MQMDKASLGEPVVSIRGAEHAAGHSRRGILTAIIGSMVAVLLSGIRPKSADAHTDQLTKGKFNIAETETFLWSRIEGDKATLALANDYSPPPGVPPSYSDGLRVFTAGAGGGAAVQAFGGPNTFSRAPHGGIGVRAVGASTGVIGESAHASSGTGVFGKGFIGVSGSSRDSTGVRGRGLRGVHGITNRKKGVGVLAQVEEGGTALEAKGSVKFSSAGLATIAAGTSSVSVTPGLYVTVDANAKILCTLQSTGGVLLNVIRNAANNTFTINLTANATADVTVAWFLIN